MADRNPLGKIFDQQSQVREVEQSSLRVADRLDLLPEDRVWRTLRGACVAEE